MELCKWSFDAGVRGAGGTGGENPTIVDMARVECPAELVQLTQIKANNIDCLQRASNVTDSPYTVRMTKRQSGFYQTP